MTLISTTQVFSFEKTFTELMSAAKTAIEKGDFDNAMANFNSALRATSNTKLKLKVVHARNRFLLQNKKYEYAENLLKEFLDDKPLPSPLIRRKVLTLLAGQVLWRKPDDAKQYLEQTMALPFNSDTQAARTRMLLGYVYLTKKQPENALEVWLPIIEKKGKIHPAILSPTSHQIGIAFQKIGDFRNARKYFQKAIDYGKKVTYKYDYSASEKALKKLTKTGK